LVPFTDQVAWSFWKLFTMSETLETLLADTSEHFSEVSLDLSRKGTLVDFWNRQDVYDLQLIIQHEALW